MALRRRVPRQTTGWSGTCSFGDEPNAHDCRVLDISVIGAGIEVFGAVPDPIGSTHVAVNATAYTDVVNDRLVSRWSSSMSGRAAKGALVWVSSSPICRQQSVRCKTLARRCRWKPSIRACETLQGS